jgi:hypothetical protein
MPRGKDGFINSWDRAQAHGKVWLSTSDVRWVAHAPKGRAFKEHVGEKLPWSMKDKSARLFKTFTEATEWAETTYGITGWKRDSMGAYHPSETDHDVACEGYSSFRVCSNRRKPGETMCGVHLGVVRRDTERAVRMKEMTEGWKRDEQLRRDCLAAAEPLGIPVGKGNHVRMHAEDFLALCRELTELRELREM